MRMLTHVLVLMVQILKVLGVNEIVVIAALENKFKDFEDGIQIITAEQNNMDAIVTRNIKDFEISEVPVYLPKDYLKIL